MGTDAGPPSVMVDRLVLNNFKSYEGEHVIGPFTKFTCIIGPNGAGKSNVMDALSFVLGVQARHLRSDAIKQLVHRKEHERLDDNERTASVTLLLRRTNAEDEPKMLFRRVVNSKGETTYRFGDENKQKIIPAERYLEELRQINVLVKARNFLVFQGDVMQLSTRGQGYELTRQLETISGSDRFKDEYERLEKLKNQAEEAARYEFTSKRSQQAESNQLLLAKEDAMRYQHVLDQKNACALEMFLFSVFSAEQSVEREMKKLVQAEQEGRDVDKKAKAAKDELNKTREALAKAADDRYKLEQAAERLRAINSQQKPRLKKAQDAEDHANRALAKHQRDIESLKKEIDNLEQASAETKTDLQALEQEIQKSRDAKEDDKLNLSAADEKEYNKIKDKVSLLTREMQRQMRDKESEFRDVHERRLAKGSTAGDLQRAIDKRETELHQIRDREVDMKSRKEHLETIVTENDERLKTMVEELKEIESQRDKIRQERRACMAKEQGMQADKNAIRREQEVVELVNDMKKGFPGVHGRMCDLYEPTQKKFQIAIFRGLGRSSDTVIVDTAKTAQRCIAFLKDNRKRPMDFFPLDHGSKYRPEMLQKLVAKDPSKRHLPMKCISLKSEEMRPAFEMAFQDLLLISSMDEGKVVAYREAKSMRIGVRVVTLDGETIEKNGNMGVSMVDNAAAKAQLRDVAQLGQQIKDLDKDLKDIEEFFRDSDDKRKRLENVTVNARKELTEIGPGLVTKEEERLHKEGEMVDAKRQLAHIQEDDTEMLAQESLLQTELRALGAEIEKVEGQQFKKLSTKLGMKDLHSVEQAFREQREKKRQEEQRLHDIQSQLKAEFAANENRVTLLSTRIKNMGQQTKELEKRFRDAGKEVEQVRSSVDKDEQKLKEAREPVNPARARETELEMKVKQMEEKEGTSRKERDDNVRKIRAARQGVNNLRLRRMELLRNAHQQGVTLPTLSGELAALVEADDDDEGNKAALGSTEVVIDYEKLPEQRKLIAANPTMYDINETLGEYTAKLQDLSEQLEQLPKPNMKAIQKAEMVQDALCEAQVKAAMASEATKKLSAEFEEVRKKRFDAFMKCFRHVEQRINHVYRDITTVDDEHEGGQAFLDLDEPSEPYKGGVKFTAMPPSKRFRDMDLLSGGEKTMAAMSLMFAMHSYSRPPFMVLDEVDAPLDARNTASLTKFLKNAPFQTIVISLKDKFFSQSETLVGVYKDQAAQTSGTLQMDLAALRR